MSGDSIAAAEAAATGSESMIFDSSEQATVKWVKGLEFGVAFKHIHPLHTDRLKHLLETLIGDGSYSRPAKLRNMKPPAA